MNINVDIPGQIKIAERLEEMVASCWTDKQIWFFLLRWWTGSELELQALIANTRAMLNLPDPDAIAESIIKTISANIRATPYRWTDPDTIPMRDWLYGRHLIRKFVSAVIAPGAVGKSSLLIAETLAMVSGLNLLGIDCEELRVWYYNLEDPEEETTRRIQATAKYYDLCEENIGDRLFVDCGREHPLTIARIEDREMTICTPVIDVIVEQIIKRGIDVLIIDPFVSCHQVPENDNGAIDMVIKEWGRVADLGNCAVVLVHHVKKGETEIRTESARGAGAFGNGARDVRTLNRMTEEEAKRAGVDNPRLYFRTYSDKPNMAPPVERSEWFKLASIDLGNGPFAGIVGDNVGVVTKWEWPNWLDGVTGGDFERAAAAIRAGKWRENIQCKSDWVGIPVAKALGLNLAVKAERAQVAGLIKAWLAAGSLAVVQRLDEHRDKRNFVEVADDE